VVDWDRVREERRDCFVRQKRDCTGRRNEYRLASPGRTAGSGSEIFALALWSLCHSGSPGARCPGVKVSSKSETDAQSVCRECYKRDGIPAPTPPSAVPRLMPRILGSSQCRALILCSHVLWRSQSGIVRASHAVAGVARRERLGGAMMPWRVVGKGWRES
jgi:hypothetical protein